MDALKQSVAARRISKDAAKIENIPFLFGKPVCGNLGCGDLVRINPENEITAILEHAAHTRMIVYGDSDQQTREELTDRYAKLRAGLEPYDIETEGIFAGVCSISVPLDIDDDELEAIADELDVQVLCFQDEDD